MNHDAVRRRLSAYMEEGLSARDHHRVETHLDACPACREELRALERTVHLLRGLEPEQPPDGLAAKVAARLDAGEGQPPWTARFSRLSVVSGWMDWAGGAWTAPLVTAVAGLALVLAVQGIEVQVTWPGAGPEPSALAEAAPAPLPVQPAPAAPASALAARTHDSAAPAAGATLRTRCLRQPGSEACAAWHSWLLGLAVDEPRAFVIEVDAVPASARGRWLTDLSLFAAHSGSAPRVAERLRQAPDPRAQDLAPHFERVSAQVPR